MAERRIDRIEKILRSARGHRMPIRHVLHKLHKLEGNSAIPLSSVYIAIRSENELLDQRGEPKKFITSSEGEEVGWVRLGSQRTFSSSAAGAHIERQIRDANAALDQKLREWLQKMHWRTFESSFLTEVLRRLGFDDIEITQHTRDGGVDARGTYRRGIVKASLIVSAKHWPQATVGPDEVRRLRGIVDPANTGIIITTGRFSEVAKQEAEAPGTHRLIALIDGSTLIETCKSSRLGVRIQQLPELLVLDEELSQEEEISDSEADDAELEEIEDEDSNSEDEGSDEEESREDEDEDEDEPSDADDSAIYITRRLLGDAEHGLSVQDIVKLTDLSEGTVRNYLCDSERRSRLLRRLRTEPVRSRALLLIKRKRG